MFIEQLALDQRQAALARQRWTERALLITAWVFLAANTLALSISRGDFRLEAWWHLLAWTVCAIAGVWLLDKRLPRRDPLLFPLALIMTGWGIIAIERLEERLEPIFADRQTVWLIISVGAMLIVASLPQVLRWLRVYRYTLLVIGLALLVSTILLGSNPSAQPGAPELWLGFGTVFFQPSEPLKIILVAFLASYMAEQYPALRAEGLEAEHRLLSLSPRILGPILLMWGLSVVFLVWQRDLGTAILIFVVFLTLLYVASGYTPLLLIGAVLVLIAGIAAYQLFAVVQLRVDIWINPWPEASGDAYQIVQSLFAFASGGVFGQGIGQGAPNNIPVVHSDFIFAAIAEEWGLLGVIAVIGCLMTLVTRGLRSATLQRGRPFTALLAVGLSLLIGLQSLLIMGGVLKLIPLTGVTLPFFSYGGSSLLTNFVILALLLRLSSESPSPTGER
ncbi:MAG: FtsW/RodA/SpoVE family cell cycle protein [Chloroflexi bacterium]|nr:FtsW/RodA/SpoVE family cell cycle protein [Chloroflexota bacterium]